MAMIPVDHGLNLPEAGMITMHVCERDSNTIVRKFRSNCGNTLEVHVTRKSGYVRSITPLFACQANCLDCQERTKAIRELIAREHKSS